MERIEFSIKHFFPQNMDILSSMSDQIKKGFENRDAFWNRNWLEKVLRQGHSYLDRISSHNVAGNLNEDIALNETKKLIFLYRPNIKNAIFNSEWAWWPNHNNNNQETALRIAHILYLQAKRNIYGSLYLGPGQPQEFKKALGVIHFNNFDPNQVEKTKTLFSFRLMSRALLGGKFVEVLNSLRS